MSELAMIVGAGPGLSASLARALRRRGHEGRARVAQRREALGPGGGDRFERIRL